MKNPQGVNNNNDNNSDNTGKSTSDKNSSLQMVYAQANWVTRVKGSDDEEPQIPDEHRIITGDTY